MDYLKELNELNEISIELAKAYNKYFYNIENPKEEIGANNIKYFKNEFFLKKSIFDAKINALSKFLDEKLEKEGD